MMRRLLMFVVVAMGSFGAATGTAQTTDNGSSPPASGRVGANVLVGSGTLASNGTPTSPLRIFRDGVPSACASVKAYPGDYATPGPYAYQTIGYTNTGPSRCVTFTFMGYCAGGGSLAGVFLAAYNGAFVPANLSANYIGDMGSSPVAGLVLTMALNLGHNQSITLMVGQVNPTSTSPVNSCSFSVQDDQQIVVPTMSPASMAAMAGLLALLGFAFLRRRAGPR